MKFSYLPLTFVCTLCFNYLGYLSLDNLKPLLASNYALSQKTEAKSFDSYMQAGYEASKKKDYSTAINNFQEALTQKPQNIYAQQALTNVTNYAYKQSMQAGYQATESKDYDLALTHFKLALKYRPQDIYAQQAINNVQSYINRAHNLLWTNLLWLFFVIVLISVTFWLWRTRQKNPQPPSQIKSLLPEARKTSDTTIDIPREAQNPTEILAIAKTETHEALAIENTATISNTDRVTELIAEINDYDVNRRRKAIWELAQKGDSRAITPLFRKMIDSDSNERSLILEALSQISARTLAPMNQALVMSLQDENPQVRKNAIRDLTKIYDSLGQLRPILFHAMQDEDPEVREIAEWGLNKLNMMQILPRGETLSIPEQKKSNINDK